MVACEADSKVILLVLKEANVVHRLLIGLAAVLLFVGVSAGQPGSGATPADAKGFMGTWRVELTEAMSGAHTIKISESNGTMTASVGSDNSTAIEVTGIVKDGNMLVLTISRDGPRPVLENGAPIWALYALTLDGDTMKAALMLEQSRTIKRGTGKRLRGSVRNFVCGPVDHATVGVVKRPS
jgi:hypothetical protein